MVKQIKLTKGQVTLVDDEDFEELNKWSWKLSTNGYAIRCPSNGKTENGRYKYTTIRMHRVIMRTPNGLETDHINGNRLDNRKCNLRNITRADNLAYARQRKYAKRAF